MPSRSSRELSRGLLLAAGMLGACSTAAPPLPQDTTAVNRTREIAAIEFAEGDLALDCTAIARERDALQGEIRTAQARVAANGPDNQAATYLGGLFPPLLLATEANEVEKQQISAGYARRDVLLKLGTFKQCPD